MYGSLAAASVPQMFLHVAPPSVDLRACNSPQSASGNLGLAKCYGSHYYRVCYAPCNTI
jgi:hypothetical protein